jgi:Na+/proline symporter
MKKMERDKVNDKLTAHYLGGRDFGAFLTAGTVFASIFSGYTVIGVPNEAYNSTGWSNLRWVAICWMVIFGYLGTSVRLRKSSNIRNHQSPVDFITDRYQSQILRYSIVFLQVVPAEIYLAAQVAAIRSTFNAMFELDAGTVYPVILIMLVILLFEWLGGLSCVAATDSLQALVMFFSFIAVPSVIAGILGVGWKDLDPFSYPKPHYYQTPTKETQWDFWQFSMSGFAFFTLPHLMQRIYAANDLGSLRAGFSALTLASWFCNPVGCFIGTVGVALLNGESVPSPFASIMELLMNEGGFAQVVAVIAVTASLAAIMSTADSLVIAISQLVTVEIAYPIFPKATPKRMGWVGRIVSLLAVVISLLIGLIWKAGVTALAAIQFPLSMQAVPAFLLGLYTRSSKTDIHPWCLSIGAFSGTVYVFGVYFGYISSAPDPRPINAGITAFAAQIALILCLEGIRRLLGISQSSYSKEGNGDIQDQTPNTPALLYPGRPTWDVPKLKRFGAHTLSPEKVWKSMEGVHEPMANLSWDILMVLSISMLTPIVAENQPPIDETTGTFSNFAPPATVGGMPWWAAKILIGSLVPCLLLLDALWKMPNHFPVDEKRIEHEGIDPDLVELTLYEKGRRTSYDEQNILVNSRRSMISASMKNLGLDKLPSEDLESTSSRRRLSALVLAASGKHQLEDLAEVEGSEDVC